MRRPVFFGLIFLLALMACPVASASDQPKRIVLIHSFGRDFKPWSEYARAIREELERQTRWRLDIMDQTLASARVSGDNPEGAFVNYLGQLYAAKPLDLIITIGAPAANFVQRHRHELFSGTPVLMGAINQRRILMSAMTENDTFVAVNNDHLATFESMLRVLPATRKVMVVIGNSPLEKALRAAAESELKPLEGRIQLEWTDNWSFEEVLKSAATLPPDSAIYWHNMSVDAAGVGHEGGKALARVHAVANAPIFSYDDAYFGRELLGGPMQSVAEGGRRIASVAVRILGGEKAGDIKTPVSQFSTPKYDWRELQRWGISESRLPPGSEVYFRQPGVWEQYRWQLSAAFAIVLLQAAMIAWFLFERRRRHRAELESRGRLLEVMHLNRTASAGVLSASFSHELNQPLGAILSNTEAAEILLKADPPDISQLTEILADIRRDDRRAAEIINHLGGLLKKKGPVELQEFDLNDAVRRAVSLLGPEASSRDVVLDVSPAQAVLPVRVDAVHLQQVILNLALNAMDAMRDCVPGSRKITLETVLVGQTEVQVSVADTGPGIPHDKLESVFDTFFTTKPHGTGLGLSIARTIIANYGGRIWAENQLRSGAVFRFTLPLTKFQ